MSIISIYRSPQAQAACMAAYDAALARWPVPYRDLEVPTRFGTTHVIASGPEGAAPLVLLHGQWSTAAMWASMAGPFAATRRVYAIDQIDDVGRSAPTRIPASRADYAEWLRDVLDGLGLERPDVARLSYGGFLALNWALTAPARVGRLVLISPGVPSFGPPTGSWAIHGMPVVMLPIRAFARWLVAGMSAGGYRPGHPEMELLITSAMSVRSRVPFRPEFSEDEFGGLTVPVLFMVGDRETMYDPQVAAGNVRRLIPHAEIAVIPGAGHMAETDQPDLVIERLAAFLG